MPTSLEKLTPRIAALSEICVNYFEQLQNEWEGETEHRLLIEQHARFNLWASNLGIFRKDKNSLDSRLKNAPALTNAILQLLSSVSDNLLILNDIDRRPPLLVAESPSTSNRYSFRGLSRQHSRGSIRSDRKEPRLESPQPDSQLVQSILEHGVNPTITRLQRLSVAIRQSTKVGRHERALNYTGKTDNAREATAELERFTESLIASKFPEMEEDLTQRIISSINLRRRRLYYQRDRGQKRNVVQNMPRMEDGITPLKVPQTLIANIPVVETAQLSPKEAVLPENAPTIPETKLSTINELRAMSFIAKPVQQSQRAKSRIQNSKLDFPRKPKPAPNSYTTFTEAECPYCQVILERPQWDDTKLWRQHVIQDLEVYECVLPSCVELPPMFETPESWLNHMKEPHGEQWYCSAPSHKLDGPIVFQREEEFLSHLQQSHPSLTERQMVSLAHAALRSAPPYLRQCPFGDDFRVSVGTTNKSGIFASVSLQDHIVGHLKELALFSLPVIFEDETDFPSSASAKPLASSRGSSQVSENEDKLGDVLLQFYDTDTIEVYDGVVSDGWSVWEYLDSCWSVSNTENKDLSEEDRSLLQQGLMRGQTGDESDPEDPSYISNVLRAYYAKKGGTFPDWLTTEEHKAEPLRSTVVKFFIQAEGPSYPIVDLEVKFDEKLIKCNLISRAMANATEAKLVHLVLSPPLSIEDQTGRVHRPKELLEVRLWGQVGGSFSEKFYVTDNMPPGTDALVHRELMGSYQSDNIFKSDPQETQNPNQRTPDVQVETSSEDEVVDPLDLIDPEVDTMTSLTNVQNSVYVPDLGKWLNRRPIYDLTRHSTEIPEQDTSLASQGPSRKKIALKWQEEQYDQDLEESAYGA